MKWVIATFLFLTALSVPVAFWLDRIGTSRLRRRTVVQIGERRTIIG